MSRLFRAALPRLLQPFTRKATTTADTVVNGENEELQALKKNPEVYDPSVEPIISTRSYLDEKYFFVKPRQVWLENLDTIPEKKLGLVTLHPEIFAAQPRIDVIHENIRWQKLYKHVSYIHAKNRAELKGGGRKPWPQKGMGKARHGSIRSPLWKHGGAVHGPRSPTPYFYMIPFYTRVLGLTSTLSVKLAQDDLHIVDDLEIPTDEPSYLLDLVKERKWGHSVLFVDDNDVMSQNLALATDYIAHMNMMPVYGLNVYSMLKHETLVLTQNAARLLEDKLLTHIHRVDPLKVVKEYAINQ